jgi:hypothetical protein
MVALILKVTEEELVARGRAGKEAEGIEISFATWRIGPWRRALWTRIIGNERGKRRYGTL